MSTCVIYVSVSQRAVAKKENSLSGQIKTCREFANKHGLKIINEYSEFKSNDNSDPELLKALLEVERKQSNLLIRNNDFWGQGEMSKKIFKAIQIKFSKWGGKIINVAEREQLSMRTKEGIRLAKKKV